MCDIKKVEYILKNCCDKKLIVLFIYWTLTKLYEKSSK